MRMERINDRQVRCLITAQDLKQRKLMLRELKYGNRETSELFREILTRATTEYGFNEDELPVMIEAVPLNANELLIILSAVEDAEELDPHFAHFAEPPVEKDAAPPQETFYGKDEENDFSLVRTSTRACVSAVPLPASRAGAVCIKRKSTACCWRFSVRNPCPARTSSVS